MKSKTKQSQCFQSGCKFAELRCLSYWGRDCAKLGGTKIPVHQKGDREYPSCDPLKVKPYFMDGGNVSDDREGEDT